MGQRGRFGKYGETKRLDRLRRSGVRDAVRGEDRRTGKRASGFPRKGGFPEGRLRIRPGRLTDKAFIGRISLKVFTRYGPYREMIPIWVESGTTATLIALLERDPVGFVMVGRLWDDQGNRDDCELLAIAVTPERQNQGIGQRLLKAAEAMAARSGERRLFLHTATENLTAQKLFGRNGYRPYGLKKGFYPAGQDALMMVKDIRPQAKGHGRGLVS